MAETSKKTRTPVCTKSYITADGESHNSAQPATESLSFHFAVEKSPRLVKLADLPQAIIEAASAHGLAQKLGDSYSGKQGDEAVDCFEAVLEALMDGDWLRRAESAGPATTMLFEAVWAAMAAAGAELTTQDDGEERLRAHLKGLDADGRKALASDPAVAAEIARIKAERAAKRAAELAETAKGAESALAGLTI